MAFTTFSGGDHWWVGYRAKQKKRGYKLQMLTDNVSFCFAGSWYTVMDIFQRMLSHTGY